MVASGGEVERFSSSTILGLSEASVILIVIGSLGGLADERLVDAQGRLRCNSRLLQERVELEIRYHLKREDKLSYLSNW